MPQQRLVIIGGVAAGMSAASRARKLDPQLEIVVLEKGRHVSYGTCGLPYYLSGQVADASESSRYGELAGPGSPRPAGSASRPLFA
jgi:NADPH-dependent 2,4-dienoyl-CoA reductase/sulfur reductase-like enzyme